MDKDTTSPESGAKGAGSPHANSGGDGGSPKPKRRKVNHGKSAATERPGHTLTSGRTQPASTVGAR
jgi:hypothetical protein